MQPTQPSDATFELYLARAKELKKQRKYGYYTVRELESDLLVSRHYAVRLHNAITDDEHKQNAHEVDRKILATGSIGDCLFEALYWLDWYCASEDGEMEPIHTAMTFIERADFLWTENKKKEEENRNATKG